MMDTDAVKVAASAGTTAGTFVAVVGDVDTTRLLGVAFGVVAVYALRRLEQWFTAQDKSKAEVGDGKQGA